MQALPVAAYFLFLEAAVGGVIALVLIYLRGEVNRGFTLFTGWGIFLSAAIAILLRGSFPPAIAGDIDPLTALNYHLERPLSLTFAISLGLFLVLLQTNRLDAARRVAPLPPLF